MRWLAILFALVLSTAAPAQTAGAGATPDAHGAVQPTGLVKDCDAFNPGTPVHAVTVLAVRILATGDVVAPSVKASSGNPALDAAALACAPHMRIPAPTVGGEPIDVTWIVVVGWWKEGVAHYFVPRLRVNRTECDYPWLLANARIGGVVGMSLHIGPDGRVQSATIVKSSGMRHLDDASVRCALALQYPPVLVGDRPAAVDLGYEMSWSVLSDETP